MAFWNIVHSDTIGPTLNLQDCLGRMVCLLLRCLLFIMISGPEGLFPSCTQPIVYFMSVLCAFLDIEGVFDNTSTESIERAATRKDMEPLLLYGLYPFWLIEEY